MSLALVGCRTQESPVGLSVTLLRRGPDPFPGYTDGDNLYIMTILPKHLVRIRNEHIPYEDLGNRIEKVFRTRTEKLLLVEVEGQLEYGDVIEVLERARSWVPLRFGLMTELTEPTPAEPSLFVDGEVVYTRYFFPPVAAIPLSKRAAGRSHK
jgi:hypothetical protein